MIVRNIQPADVPVLQAMHEVAGYEFEFPDPAQMEEYLVVEHAGIPIMAAAAKLVPEILLVCAPDKATHALVKFKGLQLLHEELRARLMNKGHAEAIASVPPELERNYGRHLQRHFHWLLSWTTYRIRDWKRGQ